MKNIFKNLKERKAIETTRSGKEFNKYKLNKIYKWYNFKLKVMKIKTLTSLKTHPFYNLLTSKMKNSIKKGMKYSNNKYNYIELKSVS